MTGGHHAAAEFIKAETDLMQGANVVGLTALTRDHEHPG